MREALQAQEGVRATFRATFSRYGTKPAYKGPPITTLLLVDITDKRGKIVAGHLWCVQGKQFAALSLQEGDIVEFDARVTQYEKGYKGYREDVYDAPIEVDYRLSNPTKVRKIAQEQAQPSITGAAVTRRDGRTVGDMGARKRGDDMLVGELPLDERGFLEVSVTAGRAMRELAEAVRASKLTLVAQQSESEPNQPLDELQAQHEGMLFAEPDWRP